MIPLGVSGEEQDLTHHGLSFKGGAFVGSVSFPWSYFLPSGPFICMILSNISLESRSGVLRTQKLPLPPLVGAQGYQRFPLSRPGVGI